MTTRTVKKQLFGVPALGKIFHATISEKTFGTGKGRQLTSAAVWPKLVEVHPATWLYMSSVKKNTILMDQRALRYMRVFCICCCHIMSRMTQPPSKMTPEIPQRCAKSSSENDAKVVDTFFEICCPPSPSESLEQAIAK